MNPYEQLEDKAFWRKAVADKAMFDICDLWQPKFQITEADPVVTYGSCFAQHIGRALKERGYAWLITESSPSGCSAELAREYNYDVFSARTANIYTTSLLHQWTRWALDPESLPDEVWRNGDRFIDPFRPQIEPQGFATQDDLTCSRLQAVASFRLSIVNARYFVFTLGLTESWFNAKGDYEYPMCPGTVAGEYLEGEHLFVNQRFDQVHASLVSALANIRKINPSILFILTVSPVPLTATASGKHVLVATMQSKSTLRAVAGEMAERQRYVDYFPSYEIINGTPFGGIFFEPNKRSVHPRGVEFVMDSFFAPMTSSPTARRGPGKEARPAHRKNAAAEVCEEALLDAFGR